VRRLFVLLGVVFVITGAVNLEVYSRDLVDRQQPVDFELNWVGAHRLIDREPLYDRAASQRDGFELIGPGRFDFSNGATYASYIGSPATALLYVPFVPFDHDPAADLYRVVQVVLMADLRWWEGRRVGEIVALLAVLAGGLALMWKKTLYPTADVVRSDWTRRLESGTKTVGMMAFLAVALWLLARPPEAMAPEGGPDASARRLDAEEAPSGEEGVHARR